MANESTGHSGFLTWKEYIQHLETTLEAQKEPARAAALHLEIAGLWERHYLQRIKSLSHYQQAFKFDPSSLPALIESLRIYWSIGRITPMQRLFPFALQLSLTVQEERVRLLRLYVQYLMVTGELDALGDVCDEILSLLPQDVQARSLQADARIGDAWEERVRKLIDGDLTGTDGAMRLFRGAVLLASRGGDDRTPEVTELLSRAVLCDPSLTGAWILLESDLLSSGDDALLDIQSRVIGTVSGDARAAFLMDAGYRWMVAHDNVERAIPFLTQACRLKPDLPGLFGFLLDLFLTGNETGAAVELVESVAEQKTVSNRIEILESAVLLWWRTLDNVSKAKIYFAGLKELQPHNEVAEKFFEECIMTNNSGTDNNGQLEETAQANEEQHTAVSYEPDRTVSPALEDAMTAATVAEDGGADAGIKAWQSVWDVDPGHPAILEALDRLYSETGKWTAYADFLKRVGKKATDPGKFVATHMKLAAIYGEHLSQDALVVSTYQAILKQYPDCIPALDASIEKYQVMERWPDLVKMLKAKGEVVKGQAEAVDIWLRVANLFMNQFSNQAEAIKAFEQVLEADPTHPDAIVFLKDMYEKRRDWKRLLDMMQLQANAMEDDAARVEALVEIARMSSERLKKPEVCIPHWEAVLALDPENQEALTDLAGFYERAKEWQKLADVLEKTAAVTVDAEAQKSIYQKLGVVYGEKVNDDARAVEAWKALLVLDPEDRRAQEQLKKRYLTLQAWDELEAFYADSEKWDELIRVLEREAERTDLDVAARVGIYFKVAQLWADKKQRADKSTGAIEQILVIDQANLQAAEMLIPVYEAADSEHLKLANALEVRLSHEDDPQEKLWLLQRISRLVEEKVGDANRAFEGFRKVFEQNPGDEDAQADLERTAGSAGRWEEVVELYRTAWQAASDGSEKTSFRINMARIMNEELGKSEEALSHFNEILSRDPKNARAIHALERIYAQMGRFQELLDIYAKRIEMAADDDERKEIFYNQALLWEEEIDDPAKAIDVYNRIIAMAGDEQRALSALDRLYVRQDKWSDVAVIIDRELALGLEQVSDEIDLKFRLGEVCRQHLHNVARALECYREVLELAPDHDGAVRALEELLSEEASRGEAAAILAPRYEAAEKWEDYVRLADILAAATEDAMDRYDLFMKIGQICAQQLDSAERAFSGYSRAFRVNPNMPDALAQLERLTMVLDSWKDFVELLEAGAASVDDPETGKALWLKAAQINDTQLDNAQAAVAAYRSALKLDLQCMDAIVALEEIFGREQKWSELVELLRLKVDAVADAAEKQSIYRQMARIHEEMLEQPEAAVESMKEILNIDPTNLDALQALDRLFVALEKWTDLADVLQQLLGLETDVEKLVELKLRLASVREVRLNEASAAIDIYKEVIELDSANPAAVEALERIVQKPEHQKEVAAILEPIYRELGQWENLIGVMEIMISQEETVGRRVDLLHEIAGLYETAGDEPDKAFATFGRALREDPEQERTQEELERMARVLSCHEALAGLYEELVGSIDNGELSASYHMKIAAICEEHLQDLDRAIRHYRNVLAIEPMHLDAATALERAYQINENYEDLAAIYLKKAEMVSDVEEQKELLFKGSQIYEDVLEKVDIAIGVYKQILEIDGDELRAINQLEGLYLRLENWDELQAIYNRKVDLVQAADEKKEVLYVLGAMYERELKDPQKATTTYQRILEFDPDDVQAIQRLDILFAEAQAWPDLLSILEREIELVDDPDEAVSYKFRVAELYVRHLEDVSRAIEYLKDILSVSPDHDLSIKLLEELLVGTAEPMQAAEVLEPLYQNTAEWRKLVGLIEVKLKNTEEAWGQVELLHQAAELLESDLYLDSPSEAFNMYARALRIDPVNDTTLSHLDALANSTSRWADLADLIDELTQKLEDDAALVMLSLRVGAIYEEQLQNPDRAIERYSRVLEVEQENREAVLKLDSLYQVTQRWEALAGVLLKEVSLMEDPEQQLAVQFRLGQLYQNELNAPAKAVEVYREILATEPSHDQTIAALDEMFAQGTLRAEILEILEPLLQMQGEWTRLSTLYQRQLETMSDRDERVSMMHKIAETMEEKLIDPVEAFNWYCRAFAENPSDERSGTDVERLATGTDAWNELADLYEKLFGTFTDVDAKKLVAKRAARVAEEELGDAARAERAFRSCLDLGDKDLDVLHALDRIYTQYMEWERLVPILEMLALGEPAVDDQVTCIYRMGDVLESQLDEVDKARVAFHRIVDELEPGHRDALARLEMIYANREDWKSLSAIYQKMKETAANEAEEADLLARMATISSECLKDISGAIELWNSVLGILGEDVRALQALSELYARQENWTELVDVLERAVSIAEDDDTRVKIYSQMGVVWGEYLKRDKNALENWQNVLSIDLENIPALKAIAGIHEVNQEWEDLVETLERIIEVGASSFEMDELKSYYFKLAKILCDVVERPMDAIDVWRKALDVDPTDLRIVGALESLYFSQELWEELVDVLGRKAELLEGQEQIDTWMAQAKALEEQLQQPLDAKGPYLHILSVAPLHEHAFEKTVEILTEQEDWESLIQLYSARLEHVVEPGQQILLLHKAARLYEDKLKQVENAFYVMQRAFVIDYSNDETADYLEHLASESGKWTELFAGCNQVLAGTTDHRIQVELCLKIGKWYAAIGKPDYAIQYFQQVLTLDTDNVPALRQMGQLYRAAKQWPELVEVLRRAVDCEEDRNIKKDILVDLGEILLEYLQDLPEARRVYKEALAIDPTLESALVALERMFRATENWEELIPILRRKIEVLDETQTETIINTRQRIAEIYENNLNELSSATEEYKANIAMDPGHLSSLKGLERLYQKQQQWQNLLDILEIQLDYAPSERERIDLLSRLARMLEEEFRKPDKAIERLEEVISIDAMDVAALQSLEKLYRLTGKWDRLIDTYEKHVDATPDRRERIPLLDAMGTVFTTELKNIDRAMDVYQQILDIEPENESALDNLAKQQVSAGDWSAAHDTLNRLVNTVSDRQRRVDLYFRLGVLNEEQLKDRGTAVEHFRSALDIDAGHLDSLAALKAIHIDEGEWIAAADVLETQQEHTENLRQKSKLQYELGQICRDKLDEEDKAIAWFERALASDSDNQSAAEPLVDVYMAAERWADAEQLLDMLVRLGGKRPAEELRTLQTKLGRVADKLGKLDKALKMYQAAHEVNTQHLPSLLDYADALYRGDKAELWDKAFKLYQMVLVHHRDDQGKSEIVDIFYRLGRIKALLGERRKALNMFDKALEIDAAHVPTLEAVIELQDEQKNYEQVIHFKKVLIDSVDDVNKQFELHRDIGDIWQDKLKNPQKAISAYQEASALVPNNRPILHKLMPLYQTTKQWQNVVDVVKRVCTMEEDKDKLAKLYYTIAAIYRDEIKSAEDAVECFNLALDNSLENLKAFEAIDKILTQQKDWKQLERNYRKMIHRIAGKGKKDIEINLWHFLGEIYRTRMGQFEAAAEAFKMASMLDPDNVTRHEILAELYTKMPDKLEDAVAQHLALIEQNPYKVDSYKALRRLYFEHRQYDKAWCLCATLAFLKKADAEEQQFFEQYRTRGTVRAQARLDNERWIKDLFHKDESVYVGKIFEIVTRAVRSLKIQPIKNFGLKKTQKRATNDTLMISKTFFYVAQVINLPVVPELYLQEESPGGLNFAVTEPMASACGSALLTGYSPQDLLFLVTKHLTYYRPEHYLRWVLPSHGELKGLMLACLKIGNPGMNIPDKDGVVGQWQRELEKIMTSMEVDNLQKVVARFVKSGEQADLKKWIRSLELTACRAGFLLSNDLETAAKMIQAETTAVDDLSPKEKIKELVLFSVSEEYFRLREAMGIIIGT